MLNGMPEGGGWRGMLVGQKGVSNREFKPFQEKQSPSAALGKQVINFFFWPYMDSIFIFFLYTSI